MAKKQTKIKIKSKIEETETIVDLNDLYSVDPENIQLDISVVRYSNLAYVQANPRDIIIDFLEMPGTKKEDKLIINGTRIYLTHFSAKKLAGV